MRKMAIPFMLMLAALLAGCSTSQIPLVGAGDSFLRANKVAANALIEQIETDFPKNAHILIGSASTTDDLNRSSPFGRLLSEQVSAQLTQNGYRMIELKMQNFAFMKRNEGEFFLTRELESIAKSHNADAVIVATYTIAKRTVYINLKAVDPFDKRVIAAHDYTVGLSSNIRSILGIPEPYRPNTLSGQIAELLDL